MQKKQHLGNKLEEFDQKDRKDQDWGPGRLDLTDYAPDPVLEDEYFGGFRKSVEPERESRPRRPRGAPKDVSGCHWRLVDGWGWGLFPCPCPSGGWSSPYRLGWTLHRSDGGILCRSSRSQGPKSWAAERPTNGPYPFVLQAVKQAEQKLRTVDPERDRAEELDRRERRPADPPFTPHGILHEERAHFYARHTERRIQALVFRGFKPSRKLELKRMPSLKRIEPSSLLTKDYLARTTAQIKNEHRALLARLRVDGGTPLEAAIVAPEKTAAQLKSKKMGRPPISGRAMTTAERKRRSRVNQKSKTLPTQERHLPGAAVPTPHRPAVPGFTHIGDDMGTLILKRIAEFEAAQEARDAAIWTLLREVVAKLEARMGTDYNLTREEFGLVSAAAYLERKH